MSAGAGISFGENGSGYQKKWKKSTRYRDGLQVGAADAQALPERGRGGRVWRRARRGRSQVQLN
jgi:hypothetical protein